MKNTFFLENTEIGNITNISLFKVADLNTRIMTMSNVGQMRNGDLIDKFATKIFAVMTIKPLDCHERNVC